MLRWNELLMVPLTSPHWRYMWFTGTLFALTMLNTNNGNLLKLSPSLTSSTRPSPSLSHSGGCYKRAVGGQRFYLNGGPCAVCNTHSAAWRRWDTKRCRNLDGFSGTIRGIVHRVQHNRGAPFFPTTFEWQTDPEHHLWPQRGLKKRLYSAGLEGEERSREATQPEGGA